MKLVFFAVLVQLALTYGALPDVSKCDLTDASCVKSSGQALLPEFTNGDPEAGVEVLDVMHIDAIKFELAGLKLSLKNIDIKGLKNAVIDKLNFDMKKKQLQLVYHADINLKGQYKAGGRLLILPITGDGDIIMKLKYLKVDVTMPFEMVKNSEDKEIISLTGYKYKFDVKDGATFNLTNLFNGNKQLSEAMLSFMNENWKILSQEFGKPLLEDPIKKVYNSIKNYLQSQPLEQITVKN